MRDLTAAPFGVNLPILFLKDDAMVRFICESGVKFVTTSAGSPAKFIGPLKAAGIVVYHAVPTLDTALKCVAAGIDGLVVEGRKVAASRARRKCRRWSCSRRSGARPTCR